MGAAAEAHIALLASWEDYHRAMSTIAAEMIGAASYFAKYPDYATDERLAATFREYAERFGGVEMPS